MNYTQKIWLWIGATILAAIWLFPPFVWLVQPMNKSTGFPLQVAPYTMNSFYHFVFGNPEGFNAGITLRVDWVKLLASSLPVVMLTATAVATTATSKP